MRIPDDYTYKHFQRDKRYLRMRETDPFYRLTSSPLTYLVGGLFFTGASALLANQTSPDTTEQAIDFIGSRFFWVVAGANYLVSGIMAWTWHATKRSVREYENQDCNPKAEEDANQH